MMPSSLQAEPETDLQRAQERYRREQRAEQSPSPIAASVTIGPPRQPLTFWKVALAVFVGNLLTGIVAALLYAVSR